MRVYIEPMLSQRINLLGSLGLRSSLGLDLETGKSVVLQSGQVILIF